MPDPALALSLDIGTSSTRALLWDAAGHEVEGVRAQIQYQMETTPDGGVEMSADAFVGHVAECLDAAMAQAGQRAGAIRLVGISSYWHSLLGLDSQNRPVTPVYSWADTRAGSAARWLRVIWDEAAVHARTGCMIHSSYWPAKIAWLRESRADLFGRVARWASPAEYLFGQLFGAQEERVSISLASATGLFDQTRCIWDAETLAALRIDQASLAPIVDESSPSLGLQDPFAKRWPALKDVPFYPAVGDGACGNIGSGCVDARRMAINVGTSGAIRVVRDERSQPPATLPKGLWRYRVDGHRTILGAAFSDGGNVFAWMNNTLKLPPADTLERELAGREPGGSGLTFLPFLAGERSIGWNPYARAALTGLSLNTGPVDILAGALEAVALRFALAMDLLEGLFPAADEIVASGGALAHSPAWAQMFADALGTPVTLAAEPEASSRGAALLAMEAAGLIGPIETVEAQLGTTYRPNPVRRERYKAMLQQQQDLYRRLF